MCTSAGAAMSQRTAVADQYVYSTGAGPAPLDVIGPTLSMNYGDVVPTLTPTYQGFVNGDTASSLSTPATCTTTATPSSPPAAYPVTCSGAVDPDYSFSYTAGSITVGTAPLDVIGPTLSMNYGDVVPTLTPTYQGFVNGDTASSLSTPATCTTTATPSSPARRLPRYLLGRRRSRLLVLLHRRVHHGDDARFTGDLVRPAGGGHSGGHDHPVSDRRGVGPTGGLHRRCHERIRRVQRVRSRRFLAHVTTSGGLVDANQAGDATYARGPTGPRTPSRFRPPSPRPRPRPPPRRPLPHRRGPAATGWWLRWWGLLARRRPVFRVAGGLAPRSARLWGWPRRRTGGVLVGGLRWRGVLLRRRPFSGRRVGEVGQADCGDGPDDGRARVTGWSPPTAGSSPSATPPSTDLGSTCRSTSRLWGLPPRRTARATGWSPPTAGSSPTATQPSTDL